ncbi:hypothetical protein Salat_0195500 [Sesamum alatum]|uniref:Uncharacterized protein n=1 Tax=Sesamum alatum TaxID=300844 RepID=A0AAE1YXT5_9LAMI|nr:hypothetical protein Salat_0195500 [Sesamum alatum]
MPSEMAFTAPLPHCALNLLGCAPHSGALFGRFGALCNRWATGVWVAGTPSTPRIGQSEPSASSLGPNLRRRNSPAVATPPPSDVEVFAAPIGDQPSGSFERQVLAPIEVASVMLARPRILLRSSPWFHSCHRGIPPGSKDASAELEVALAAGEPSKSKKHKWKTSTGKSKSSSKSNKRSSKQSERHVAKEAAEEEENTKHLKELVAWWKQACEELKTPSSKVAEMEGEKLGPNWAISARSSVM